MSFKLRAGEPELGAMEPGNFGGARVINKVKFLYCMKPELEPEPAKFLVY